MAGKVGCTRHSANKAREKEQLTRRANATNFDFSDAPRILATVISHADCRDVILALKIVSKGPKTRSVALCGIETT